MLRFVVLISTIIASLSAECPNSNRYKFLDSNGIDWKWIEAGVCYFVDPQNRIASIQATTKYLRYECRSTATVLRNEFTNEEDCINNDADASHPIGASPCADDECVSNESERFLKTQFKEVEQTQEGVAEVWMTIGRKIIQENEPRKVQSRTSFSWFNYGIVIIAIFVFLYISSI